MRPAILRKMRAARRRLQYRDTTDARPCAEPGCPCLAVVGGRLCSGHMYEQTEALKPSAEEALSFTRWQAPEPVDLPFEE